MQKCQWPSLVWRLALTTILVCLSVHPTRRGKWETRWREGSRNRSRTFDRKSDAAAFDREARRTSQLGGVVPSRTGGKTLGDFIEHDWLPRKKMELTQKTLYEYAATIDRHIEPKLGHIPIIELGPARLHDWQNQCLARGAGRESISRATKLLKQILDQAVRVELISVNPATTLRSPRSERRTVRAPSALGIEALRGWFLDAGDLGSATLVSVLAYVGLRPSEALALRLEDIQGKRMLIERAVSDGEFKPTKTRRNRAASVPEPVIHDLNQWTMSGGRRKGLVWPRALDGHPWRQSNWDNWRRRHFAEAVKAADLGGLVPYDLRHVAVSLRIAAGRPITEIASDMGHSVATCANDYSHMIESLRGQPVRSVEAMIRDARRNLRREAA